MIKMYNPKTTESIYNWDDEVDDIIIKNIAEENQIDVDVLKATFEEKLPSCGDWLIEYNAEIPEELQHICGTESTKPTKDTLTKEDIINRYEIDLEKQEDKDKFIYELKRAYIAGFISDDNLIEEYKLREYYKKECKLRNRCNMMMNFISSIQDEIIGDEFAERNINGMMTRVIIAFNDVYINNDKYREDCLKEIEDAMDHVEFYTLSKYYQRWDVITHDEFLKITDGWESSIIGEKE